MAAFHRIEYDSISGEARKSPVWSIVRPVTVLIKHTIKVLQLMGKTNFIEPENEHEAARTVVGIERGDQYSIYNSLLFRLYREEEGLWQLELGHG